MEENQSTSLFGLGLDPASNAHLSEAARWAKFLAIVGFVICALIAVFGIFAGSIFSGMMSRYSEFGGRSSGYGGGFGATFSIIYIGIAILYFFPCLFLYRFANHMKAALASNQQEILNKSFQNLKIMFRYVGILTIIILSIYLLLFLIGLSSAGTGGF